MYKTQRYNWLLVTAILLAPIAGQSPQPASAERPQTRRSQVSSLSLFVQNLGQWPDAVRFQMREGNETWWFTDDGIWLTVLRAADAQDDADRRSLIRAIPQIRSSAVHGVNLRITVDNMSSAAHLVPADPQPTHLSYFRGNDPAKWRPNVPTYGSLVWQNVYPGVDLAFGDTWHVLSTLQSRISNLESPISTLHLHIDGTDRLRLDPDGRLLAGTIIGPIALPALVSSENRLLTTTVSSSTVSLSSSVPEFLSSPSSLTQNSELRTQNFPADDPSDLLYSTFLGGGWNDGAYGIAVGPDGTTYVAGYTWSAGFPTSPGSFDTSLNGVFDVCVTAFVPNQHRVIYSTFIGGATSDQIWAMARLMDGSLIVAGHTNSVDFPTTPGAFGPTLLGTDDGFVTRLNANGTALLYSTYLGGTTGDGVYGVAGMPDGSVVLSGFTYSADFPVTPGAFDSTLGGFNDGFVTRLDPTGSTLVYSTYLGGSDGDQTATVAVDAAGSAYVLGSTQSNDFPTTPDAFDRTYHGDIDDFVTKLDPTGASLAFSTYLGGNSEDCRWFCPIALGPDGSVYVAGYTYSSDFPTTPNAFEPNRLGSTQGFVSRLNPTGTALIYSTYLGDSWDSAVRAMAVDANGRAYLTGYTNGTNFPTTPGAFLRTCNSCTSRSTDAIVTVLNAAGSHLDYSTFLGSGGDDFSNALALAPNGAVFIAGQVGGSDFPMTPDALDPTYNGGGSDEMQATLNVFNPLMLVSRIDPFYRLTSVGDTRVITDTQVGASVTVQSSDGQPVAGARVSLQVTQPDGASFRAVLITRANGTGERSGLAPASGTYTFTVTNVSKPGWLYHPAQNEETSDSITVP